MGLAGNSITRNNAYVILQECHRTKDLQNGKRVQSLLAHNGLDSTAVLGDHLIRLFAYHGNLSEANEAFINIVNPSAYTWSAIISANAKLRHGASAIELYERMQTLGSKSDNYVQVSVLQACISTSALFQGRFMHGQILKDKSQENLVVGSTLVDMYAKCGSLEEAFHVFKNLPSRNRVSWNAMIAGYAQYGAGCFALDTFEKMQQEGIDPDRITFVSILKACGSIPALTHGRLIHYQIIAKGLVLDTTLGNILVDMYGKSGSSHEAYRAFVKLINKDVLSWTSMISGYAHQNQGLLAFNCFEKMHEECIQPNNVTFLSILKACTTIEQGRFIHQMALNIGLHLDVSLGNTLMDMYCKCGSIEEAFKCFHNFSSRNVVSWSIVIGVYAEYGEEFLALECFEMMQREDVKPNDITFLSVLQACSSIPSIEQGRLVHSQIIQYELGSTVVGSALIDMYAKCWSPEEAWSVFEKVGERDVVLWSAMIECYVYNEEGLHALQCYEKMQQGGTTPNQVTFLTAFKACACMGVLEQGRSIYYEMIRNGLQLDIVMGNALIDMYARCGSLEAAQAIFDKLDHDIISWGAMIAGYAYHGKALCAADLYEKMQKEFIKPDPALFISMLVACSHAGLVEEGHFLFRLMEEHHRIIPSASHLTCMVDLLGRSGYLSEAENILHALQSDVNGWLSLLSACRMHGNVELGKHCFGELVVFDSQCAAGYVLMSNIYADLRRPERNCLYEN